MKVDNITYPVLTSQHRLKSVPDESSTRLYGELCKNNSENVNRGYYSGSSVSFGAAAKFSSRMLDNLLDACNNHTTIVQNLVALVLALGPRPLAIMSLPGKKNKEDKIYASGHSMASGLIGFGFASVIMYPLGKAAEKVKENDVKLVLERLEKSNNVKVLTRRLNKLAQNKNVKPEDFEVKNILGDIKYLDQDFLKQFGTFEEKDGKLTKIISVNKEIEIKKEEVNPTTGKTELKTQKVALEKYHEEYNILNLTKEKLKEGTKYVGKKFFDNFIDYDKNGKFIRINKAADFDKVYKCLNMAPDVLVFGILKAMLTVALIPPILKHVFGIEKSKPQQQTQPVQQVKQDGGNK